MTLARKQAVIGLLAVLGLASVAQGVITKVNASADNWVYFYVTDPNGDPNLSIGITDLDIYYVEQGAAISAKVDMTALAAADSAHADNKGFNCGQGVLRVDFPDAAFDGGINKTVELIVRDVTGATDDGQKDKIFPITVQLGAVTDARYLGGSATPITNLGNVFNTDYATAFNEPNGVFNTRLVNVSKAAELLETTDLMTTADVRGAVRYQNAAAIGADPNVGSQDYLLKTYVTGDAFSRLGASAGASVSADIADLHADVLSLTGTDVGSLLEWIKKVYFNLP